MKISTQTKTNFRNATYFVLGTLATIIITKCSDIIMPNDQIVVRPIPDTVKIVHDYHLPETLDNDTVRQALEKKFKNLELLNNYDEQIKKRLTLIKQSDGLVPNLIITQRINEIAKKGYMYGSSSTYFSSDCPELKSRYIDMVIDFLNPSIIKDIAFLRVEISRFNEEGGKAGQYVLDGFYEVKAENNFIRISNDLPLGKYEIAYGFMFKEDLKEQYPKFYFKKCIVTK